MKEKDRFMGFDDFQWCYSEKARDKERFYKSILPGMRHAARRLGYAVAVHGSMKRDFDLIAVAWKKKAVGHQRLAYALWFAVTHRRPASNWKLNPVDFVLNRWRYVLPVGKTAYVDLSVIPYV